jgi:hypothetical protein
MRGSGWTASIVPNGDYQTVYLWDEAPLAERRNSNPIVHGHGFQLATLEYSITMDPRNSIEGSPK